MRVINNLSEFDEIIKGENVLVDFYADWCGPCKVLSQVFDEIEEELNNYVMIKVNTDKMMTLTRRYHIISIPDVKVFTHGKVVKEFKGLKTKDELLSILKD